VLAHRVLTGDPPDPARRDAAVVATRFSQLIAVLR
jgi:hypothetical protein